jgi:hypothetical protein
MRNAFKLSIVEPLWKRLLGRHRYGWEDDINIYFKTYGVNILLSSSGSVVDCWEQ